jgi:hypothetical protein
VVCRQHGVGIDTVANVLHPWKALLPMLVTEVGIDKATNEAHPSKALPPMLVTEVRMVTDVTVAFSTFHVLHQSWSMVVLPSGMLTCVFGNELHPLKAFSPMLVTKVGMYRVASELHRPKAYLPMLMTEVGIDTAANELHPLKALPPNDAGD